MSKRSAIARAELMRSQLSQIIDMLEQAGPPSATHVAAHLFEQARELERDLRLLRERATPQRALAGSR